MTLPTNASQITYTGNGSAVSFAFPYLVEDSSHFKVYHDGVLQASGFTLSGIGTSSITVTYAVAPASGVEILFLREVPLTQESDYVANDPLPAETLEGDFDLATMGLQQLDNRINRTLRAPDGETIGSMVLGNKAARANKYIQFDANGLPTLVAAGPDSSGGLVTSSSGTTARSLAARFDDIINVKDFGAAGDGVTDDTSAINAALAIGGFVYFPAGTYIITNTLDVTTNGTLMMGAGRGSTIIKTTVGGHRMVDIDDISDVTITHLTLEGDHPGGTGNNDLNHGIFVNALTSSAADRISLIDVEVKNITGRGIDIANTAAFLIVRDCYITNCRAGVFVFKGNDTVIVDSNILNTIRTTGIFFDDATTGDTAGTANPNTRCIISNNVLNNGGDDTADEGVAIVFSGQSTGGIVANNIVMNNGNSGVASARGIVINSGQDDWNASQRIAVTGNVVTTCTGRALTIQGSKDIVVSGNAFINNNVWDAPIANAAEIKVLEGAGATLVSSSILIDSNLLHNTGGTDSRSVVGVHFETDNQTAVHVGYNAVINLATPYLSAVDANDIFWSTIENLASLPAHDDGFKGRPIYERDRQLLMQSNGSQWNPVSPVAWCTFDGTAATPISINDGHNVTNVVRNATGHWTVNFSITLDNVLFAAIATSTADCTRSDARTTTSVDVKAEADDGTATNSNYVSVVVFGSAT